MSNSTISNSSCFWKNYYWLWGLVSTILLVACQPAPPEVNTSLNIGVEAVEAEATVMPETTQREAKLANVLHVCEQNEPITLFPLTRESYVEQLILEAVYDGPFDTRNYEYQPVIMERVPTLANGDVQIQIAVVRPGDPVFDPVAMTIVEHEGTEIMVEQMMVLFTLKEGIKWSDGTLLTASDSLYGFDILNHPVTPDKGGLSELTESYEVVNSLQVRWLGIPNYITHNYPKHFIPPMPQHAWSHIPIDELAVAPLAKQTPMGWGPYVIEEWVAGSHVTLVPNPHYFRPSYPLIEQVVFQFLDVNKTLAGLHWSGENKEFSCEVWLRHRYGELDDELLTGLVEMGIDYSYTYPIGWERLDFIIEQSDNRETPVADRRVRQAIAHAISLEEVNPHRHGIPLQQMPSFIPSSHPWAVANSVAETYPYDPERARVLLSEAGWEMTAGAEVRQKDEQKLHLRLGYMGDDVVYLFFVGQIFTQLQNVGIEVELIHLTYSDLEVYLQGGIELELIYLPAPLTTPPPCQLHMSSFEPTRLELPLTFRDLTTFRGYTGYENPDFDTRCITALQTLEGDAINLAFSEVQDIYIADLPSLPLFERTTFALARIDLQGLSLDATSMATWNIEEWYFEPLP